MLTAVLTLFQDVALAPRNRKLFFWGILALVGINISPGGKEFSNSPRILMFFKSSSGKVECMQQIGERSVRASSQSSYLSLTADGCFLALA